MRVFMEAVQKAFYNATGWDQDNSYSSLDVTADDLLRFQTPQGLHMTLSSLATSQFATSYDLGVIGVVDGSISYLYSSVPLHKYLTAQSETVSLPSRMRSYRFLSPLNTSPPHPSTAKIRPALLYGRLYLPQSMLEALVVKKLSPALQVQLSAVSSKMLRNGGTVLALAQYDVGRYALEGLASSDGGLLGLRGIYNFHAHDEKAAPPPSGDGERERIYGRFSTGAEIYYGTLNKSGGMSMGARFATLPQHTGTPLTATLTINPLMGSISASYAVMAGRFCSLGTRLDFNVYSYESDWLLGMELWRHGFAARETSLADSLAGDKTVLPVKTQSASSLFPPPSANTSSGQGAFKNEHAHVTARSSASGTSKGTQDFERSFQAKMQWRLDERVSRPAPRSAAENKRMATDGGDMQVTEKSSPPLVVGAPSPVTVPLTLAAGGADGEVTHRYDSEPSASVASTSPFPSTPSSSSSPSSSPMVIHSLAAEEAKAAPIASVAPSAQQDSEEFGAVIKARLDQNMKIGLLWEGRVKALLFSLGFAIDLRKRDQPFRTVGLELQYSS
ncbi:hypothetical protein TD95_004840 [Thielaviopsis punctulata]|uniref:Mitochondrial distribution and morphology protein 10 n=1 Tax=Thielaviopsis punctulata TaxID=72032 RepID=A0A0F4Z852_9PEZI|nr:hypothetical protein TD95_004840 [Thielaviopsis punctulata]